MTNPHYVDEEEAEAPRAGKNLLTCALAVLFAFLILCAGCCGAFLAINYAVAD